MDFSSGFPSDGFARRHPFALVSIALHAFVLTLLYYFGSYVITARKVEVQVQASVQAASHARTERRVQDMEKIKSLLEKSSGHQAAGSGKSGDEDEIEFSATSLPKQPQELLKQAQTLSGSIDDIARDIKAEETARVLKIPKEKALEQIAPPAPSAPPEEAAGQAPADPAKVAEEIRKLEAKARETLIQRQKELERQEQGVGVSGESTQDNAAPASASGRGINGKPGDIGGASDAGGASLSTRMATFINRDIPVPSNASTGRSIAGGDISDLTPGRIPALDSKLPLKGMGRIFGADGPVATRVYINSWYLIGPFQASHGNDLNGTPSYPPEQAVQLNAVYLGKDKRPLKWQYVHASSYPLIPPDEAEDAVYYGYTELMMDDAVDLTMLIGADDDARVWLNDRVVWAGGHANKHWFFHEIYYTKNTYKGDYNLNEGSARVHFKKGRNKVFFKLSNGATRVFFSMVLTK
ncbi:MAG: hypothetical protein ABIT83_02295 [Massilia sp.]